MADIRDDFPDPTEPTMAVKDFFLIPTSMFFKVGSSELLQLKEAF